MGSWGDSGFFKLKRGTCGDSTVCGALECSASGSADDVPETTSTGTEASSCDLTGWFGQITGTYNLEITSGSTTYATTCTCAHGFCTPNDSWRCLHSHLWSHHLWINSFRSMTHFYQANERTKLV